MASEGPIGDPLGADSLAKFMASSLPNDVSPQLKTPTEAIALAAHAGMLAVGFRLIGLGEEHRIEAGSGPDNRQPLPTEWNSHSNDSYAFRYAHSQSSMQFLLKVNRLGNKAVVFGIGLGDDRTTSFDVAVADYVSASCLPATPYPAQTSDDPTQRLDERGTMRALQDIFISVGRLSDLGSLLRISIIQKLLPSLQKEGYEETKTSSSTTTSSDRRNERNSPPARGPQGPMYDPLRHEPPPARPRPFDDPLADLPRRPFPPGDFPPPDFEDEYEMNRPFARPGMGGHPYNIGERDLYPQGLGPNDPLRPSFGPRLGGGGMGGGGMHPTFNDPLFAGRRGGEGGGGRIGGGGYPVPGARYDPVGPGMGAPRDMRDGREGGPRFPGQGGGGSAGMGMGGRPPNPFGGFGQGDFI